MSDYAKQHLRFLHRITTRHHLYVSLSRSQVTDLAVLIARMQKNADQVEKHILQSEKLLTVVRHPTEFLISFITYMHVFEIII